MKKAPALRFFGSAGAVSETNLRACYVSFYVRIFAHDFVGDKEKIRRHTVVRQGFLTQSAAKSAEKTCEKRCETGSQSKTSGNSFVTKDGTAVRIVMPLRSERQVSGYGSNVI